MQSRHDAGLRISIFGPNGPTRLWVREVNVHSLTRIQPGQGGTSEDASHIPQSDHRPAEGRSDARRTGGEICVGPPFTKPTFLLPFKATRFNPVPKVSWQRSSITMQAQVEPTIGKFASKDRLNMDESMVMLTASVTCENGDI